MKALIEIEAGRFVRKDLIYELEKRRLRHGDVEWVESKGFFSSFFIVSGDATFLSELQSWMASV